MRAVSDLMSGRFRWFLRKRLRITLIGDKNNIAEPPLELHSQQMQACYVQSGASNHSLGLVNKNLGSSPGWWAATVATYCMTGRLRVYGSVTSPPSLGNVLIKSNAMAKRSTRHLRRPRGLISLKLGTSVVKFGKPLLSSIAY